MPFFNPNIGSNNPRALERDALPPPAKRRKTQFGLKELAPGNNPDVDIVAIHGIDGDREDTWTANNGILWLKDLLPEKIPRARILTYGYDANTQDQEQLATSFMHDHAETFLSKLSLFREDTASTERPIIFVVHSLGGILLKSALILSHLAHDGHLRHHQTISRSTHGIAFFGTPHQGSATAELARSILDMQSQMTPTCTVLLQHLERNSESLQQQQTHYSAISGYYDTKFFYEVYDSRVGDGVFKRVVEKSSAVVHGAVNAESIGISKDHLNMVKFPSADDDDFRTVSITLSLMCKSASQKISSRWESSKTIATIKETDLTSSQQNALSNLPHVNTARFDANGRPHCLEGTRVDLLKTVSTWTEQKIDRECRRISWLSGQAGTGKTTISLTAASDCQKKGHLAASFFFSRDHADRNELRSVFPTLAYQLGAFYKPFKTLLAEILETDPDVAYIDPRHQFRKLIAEPLLHCTSFPSPAIVFIDALDECKDDDPISKVLSILLANLHDLPFLKFFITSRPEHHIRSGFSLSSNSTQSLILHDIEASVVDGDIELYLRDQFTAATCLYPHMISPGWPSDEAVKSLVEKSSRLFIFAVTAVNFILDTTYRNPSYLTNVLLEQLPAIELSSPSSPFLGLDQLYLQVLLQAFPKSPVPNRLILHQILGAIILLRKPLPPGELEILLGLQRGIVRTTLCHLHSVLVVPDTDEDPMRLIHPSFFDFATARCAEPDFRIEPSLCHGQLAIACFQRMKDLKRDMCQIHDASKLNNEIPDLSERIKRCIPPAIQYACRYWSYHMCNAGENILLQELLDQFCRDQVLYWIETMSLIGSLRDGIHHIQDIRRFLSTSPFPLHKLLSILIDVERLLTQHFDVISIASLQLYRSALPLSPPSILTPFSHDANCGVRVLQGEEWKFPEVTTLCGPSHDIRSVDFSPDGTFIVAASRDGLWLWDCGTATLLKKLRSSSQSPEYGFAILARVSPDGSQVICVTSKYFVRIWNVTSGICLQTIKLERVNLDPAYLPAFTWSPDFTLLIGTEHYNILVWNASDGHLRHVLKGHSGWISCVTLSPNRLHIASASEDCTVRVWNAHTGAALWLIRGQPEILTVAFSPDSQYIIFGSSCSIYRWHPASGSGSVLKVFEHAGLITSVAFLPNGVNIISGSSDTTVRIWNVVEGKLLKAFECSRDVGNAGFSQDGTRYIASVKNTIHVWDSGRPSDLTQPKENWQFFHVMFSPDGTLIVGSTYLDHLIYMHLWDGVTGVPQEILEVDCEAIPYLAFSPNNEILASCSNYQTIRLWDTSRRAVVKTIGGQPADICSFAFSPDSTRIVIALLDKTVRILDVATICNIFTIHSPVHPYGAIFSPDGNRIIVQDINCPIPRQVHSRPSNSEIAEGLKYSVEDDGWIFAIRGTQKERCMWLPGVWRCCKKTLSHGRVAIGTTHGLALLDLSNITLTI